MSDAFPIVQQVIRNRRTEKILGDPANPVQYTTEQLALGDSVVHQSIRDCGWAPFHYDRRQDQIAEPWRVYWLDCDSCRRLATRISDLIPDMKPNNKMPGLLSGCGSLTLFTWLPQTVDSEAAPNPQKLVRVNNEHLAATAAAVQNFLLLLTACEIGNYWASGTLIADHLFDYLGIPETELLVAAVFAHYKNGRGETECLPGKQRARRSADSSWFHKISFRDS